MNWTKKILKRMFHQGKFQNPQVVAFNKKNYQQILQNDFKIYCLYNIF
jgi:hypothetical protein